jgi:hypothetical protein
MGLIEIDRRISELSQQLAKDRARLAILENRTVEPFGKRGFDRTTTSDIPEAKALREMIEAAETELKAVQAKRLELPLGQLVPGVLTPAIARRTKPAQDPTEKTNLPALSAVDIERTFTITCLEQIAALDKEMHAQQKALESEEDREASEIIRVRLRSLRRLRSTLDNAALSVRAAVESIDHDETKHSRWFVLCRAARTAEDEAQELAKQLRVARESVAPFEAKVFGANDRLSRHKLTPLPQYATHAEISEKETQTKQLQAEYDAAHREFLDAVRKRDALENSWRRAANNFESAAFAERMGRPRPEVLRQPSNALGDELVPAISFV